MIYCYVCPACDYRVEIIKTMAEVDRVELCPEDGFVLKRDYVAEHPSGFRRPGNWPMVSTAAGVGASQRIEAMEHAKSIGIPTEFNEEGDAIFTSPSHRKKYCRAIELHDRNGSYSDP